MPKNVSSYISDIRLDCVRNRSFSYIWNGAHARDKCVTDATHRWRHTVAFIAMVRWLGYGPKSSDRQE